MLDLVPQSGQASLELAVGKQCQPGVSTLGGALIEGVGVLRHDLLDVFVRDLGESGATEGRAHLVERGEAVRNDEQPRKVANQRPLGRKIVVEASDQNAPAWQEDATQFECAGFEVRDVMQHLRCPDATEDARHERQPRRRSSHQAYLRTEQGRGLGPHPKSRLDPDDPTTQPPGKGNQESARASTKVKEGCAPSREVSQDGLNPDLHR